MPLNKIAGEQIEGLTTPYRVVPNSKYRETALFDQAATEAANAFQAAGALLPIGFDDDEVLVQEYPRERKLAMMFSKVIRKTEHFYPYVFDLPHGMIREMRANGQWENVTEH